MAGILDCQSVDRGSIPRRVVFFFIYLGIETLDSTHLPPVTWQLLNVVQRFDSTHPPA